MYRVYDVEKKEWLDKDVYLAPDGELFKIKKSKFGWSKLPLALSSDRYVYHKCIDLCDKNGTWIHEGDRLKCIVADDREVTGIVVFASELSAYIVLCNNEGEYYTLGESVCEYIEVIGNVFDDYEEDYETDEMAN